jgi:hypothetical protein
MEDEQFIAYLEGTLIPDLRESGNDATADDFEFCLKIIRDLQEEVESLDRDIKVSTYCGRHPVTGEKDPAYNPPV